MIGVLKLISTIAVSLGTGSIIGGIVKPLLADMKTHEKVCALIASAAIEGVVADTASKYMNDQIDDISAKLQGKPSECEPTEEEA